MQIRVLSFEGGSLWRVPHQRQGPRQLGGPPSYGVFLRETYWYLGHGSRVFDGASLGGPLTLTRKLGPGGARIGPSLYIAIYINPIKLIYNKPFFPRKNKAIYYI